MRLNGGRCPVLAQFDVGFTREGLIQASAQPPLVQRLA
jgi:hypothetical protein